MKNLHIIISLFLPSLFLFSCTISLDPSSALSDQNHFQNQCLDDQRSALLQLQHDLYYAPSFSFSSQVELWDLNTNCCSWKGVTCDAFGHVKGIDLSYKKLSGSFHSIFNLHHLQHLNLAGNNFNTTLFQYEFGKLLNLTYLNLSDSCFYGQIPMGISYLTRLVSLDLSNQDYCYWRNDQNGDLFYYQFPTLKLEKPNFKTLIKNMSSLRELYLDGVNISTQSGTWSESTLQALPKLSILSMSNCGLIGPFCSSLSSLHYLCILHLNDNPISYLPPKFLENSSRLVSLNLRGCNLSGHFPVEVFLLPKIQSIDISNNEHLMGQLPEFPINHTLEVLLLSGTNFSGKLPKSIGNLKFLTILYLYSCSFSGQIPSSIANLTNLVELDLGYNNFSGSIPPFHRLGAPNLVSLSLSGNHLSGSILSSLFTLPSLRFLYLRYNQLGGGIDEFPNASSSFIEHLVLSQNYLNGPLKRSIFQLSRLEWFDIGYNSFSSIKLDMFFELNNLRYLDLSNMSLLIGSHNKSLTFSQLEELYLMSCNLTEFPEFLKTQDKLSYLDLSNNQIHGFVPNWLWKSTLKWLDLSSNAIDIPKQFLLDDANSSLPMLIGLHLRSCNISMFPTFLKSQENLQWLDLSNNKISGVVPNWVWKKNLQGLDLSKNSLSSLDHFSLNQSLSSSQDSLQTPICNLSQLWSLNASYNKLSGPIPNCLGDSSTLELLDLQQNNFSGSIPEFANATQLSTLQLSQNKFEGKLPRSLANCIMLEVLNLGNNTLHDTFPLWLGKLTSLKVLILRANKFYGPIKHLKNNFPALDVLDIASNNFSGQLSIEFFHATHQLRSLKIGANKLEEKLSMSLASCIHLEVLDLGKNMIRDNFPFWLARLPSLKVLVLRSNRFYGPIKFFKDDNTFPMLRILDLASNNFSGELAIKFFQSLKAMMMMTNGEKAKPKYIGDYYYQDSVTIVNRGFEIHYQKILTLLTCLDLSNNSFHGRISEEIQNLKSLHVLNLSYNSFVGPIPSGLGSVTEIESLDLSQNNLSGKIPLQLTSLTFLAVLNLSYNQLEGSIPQSNQFGTFSNDSYKWNPKLCGLPLTRKCNEDDLRMPLPKQDEDSLIDGLTDWKILLIGYGCGLVIGLRIGYTVLNELGNKWFNSFTRNWN